MCSISYSKDPTFVPTLTFGFAPTV